MQPTIMSITVLFLCDEVITSKMRFSFTALPAHPVGLEANSRPHLSAVLFFFSHLELLLLLLLFSSSYSSAFTLSADIDMKKDIETLIAEERADIILKYATVSSNTQNSLSVFYLVQMDHVVFYGIL